MRHCLYFRQGFNLTQSYFLRSLVLAVTDTAICKIVPKYIELVEDLLYPFQHGEHFIYFTGYLQVIDVLRRNADKL